MHMFEIKNKESIFIVLSKEVAKTLEQDVINKTINELLKKVEEESPQDIETWSIKVKNYEIIGIFNNDDISVNCESLSIMLQSEYDNPIFYI